MIEIKAKLVRTDAAIYATGERVECLIEFTYKTIAKDGGENSNNNNNHNINNEENLAWASAQLHCYRKTSFHVPSKAIDLTEVIGKTTLDAVTHAVGDVIYSTKPKILFCDLKLKPNESKTYFFNENVPRDGPPTYRGHDIKYFYRLTIATQRVKSKVQTLIVPIRVLPIPLIARPDELPITEETNEELAPTNPFLEKREISELEISWHHVKNVTARRAPKFYRISNKHGLVGKFCLFKSAYKLGEDIVGSLDFTDCQVRCVQFSVKLQMQEICLKKANIVKENHNSEANDTINGMHSVGSVDMASVTSGIASDNMHKSVTSASFKNQDTQDEQTGKVTTQSISHQVCYSMVQTQIIVPIPLHVTPTFCTDLVDVRWRLHFEFVTSTMINFGKPNPSVGEIQAPKEIAVETMIWDLPITIYTANPLQIYAPSQTHCLLIK